ncbi:hypothetical protein RRG08_050905 [Elysia crispata]|uniref:Uncharacterized protein n=1 Tax=Elysia crispata TaxID=231223 RepID=A0AAE0ZTQ1_9GAST|nr:hypothetical protein RRG08_050905 [Elysia crispata]
MSDFDRRRPPGTRGRENDEGKWKIGNGMRGEKVGRSAVTGHSVVCPEMTTKGQCSRSRHERSNCEAQRDSCHQIVLHSKQIGNIFMGARSSSWATVNKRKSDPTRGECRVIIVRVSKAKYRTCAGVEGKEYDWSMTGVLELRVGWKEGRKDGASERVGLRSSRCRIFTVTSLFLSVWLLTRDGTKSCNAQPDLTAESLTSPGVPSSRLEWSTPRVKPRLASVNCQPESVTSGQRGRNIELSRGV